VKLTTHFRTQQGLKCVELYLPSPIRKGTTLPLQQSIVNKKRQCNQDTTMYPVNRLHTACRLKRNPKIRNVNVLEETCKKLPPLCKRYVQHLLILSAQGHICRLRVVQVTIIDTPLPLPKKNKNKGFIDWEIRFLRTKRCST